MQEVLIPRYFQSLHVIINLVNLDTSCAEHPLGQVRCHRMLNVSHLCPCSLYRRGRVGKLIVTCY